MYFTFNGVNMYLRLPLKIVFKKKKKFKNTHTGRENSQTMIMASIWDLINYSFHLT